jgi:hypothetical protein
MEPASQPTDRDRVREATRSGEAAYPAASSWPDGAARASLACGQPVAVADLRSGETVLDLGSGSGAQVGCIARAPSFAGNREGLTRAGFAGVSTTSTHPAGDGAHAAIIRVARP